MNSFSVGMDSTVAVTFEGRVGGLLQVCMLVRGGGRLPLWAPGSKLERAMWLGSCTGSFSWSPGRGIIHAAGSEFVLMRDDDYLL